MAAPTDAAWHPDGSPDHIDGQLDKTPPDGVGEWQARYIPADGGDWVETAQSQDNPWGIEDGAGSPRDWLVQLRWFSGTAPGLPSEWSTSQFAST